MLRVLGDDLKISVMHTKEPLLLKCRECWCKDDPLFLLTPGKHITAMCNKGDLSIYLSIYLCEIIERDEIQQVSTVLLAFVRGV